MKRSLLKGETDYLTDIPRTRGLQVVQQLNLLQIGVEETTSRVGKALNKTAASRT